MKGIHIKTVLELTELMFCNLKISMDTSDWDAEICGAPVWRYIYHMIHSCDKFYINPAAFTAAEEPPFQTPKLDWPDTPTDTVLSKETLYAYFEQVKAKTLSFAANLEEEQLAEIPEGCNSTRLGLIMEQMRHMYAHIGILNGVTIVNTGRYPRILNIAGMQAGAATLYDDDVR